MLETVITLKPKSEWRRVDTWYSGWAPEWLKGVLRRITPDHIPQEQLISEMNDALRLPGLSNAWTMPIKGRIDMLSTGLRTPVGLKISGADLDTIEEIGGRIEALLPKVPGTRSVFAERTASGYFSTSSGTARSSPATGSAWRRPRPRSSAPSAGTT